MKQLYFIVILLFSSTTFAQNDLLGEWYLDYIEVSNVIYPNYYNNESLFEIEFTQSTSNNNDFNLIGNGVCDGFGGTVTPNGNSIAFSELNFTLPGPCPTSPGLVFENKYFSIFENQNAPFNFSFVVDSEQPDQTLMITDPITGDKAVYGRTPNTEILSRTWYLSRIELPGNPDIQIPVGENPSVTFTNDINPLTFRPTAFGEGDCNAFMSDYEVTLNNGNNIQLFDFSPTLSFCNSGYEDEYFSVIGFPDNNFSEFEIINNGSTLIVTDLLGARLVFGDEPLSISENEFNTLNLTLKSNPVSDEVNLTFNNSGNNLNYEIFNITGQLINQAILQSESINVENFNSGLYFIRFSNNSNQSQTIKFIKE